MPERGILFSAAMVRAILDDRKTQTRRVAKYLDERMFSGEEAEWCPYGKPGDRLWVRETWQYDDWTEDGYPFIGYRVGGLVRLCDQIPEGWDDRLADIWAKLSVDFKRKGRACDERWRSSRFMPRFASRITLEITDVRAQRVQDISEEDARAEGFARYLSHHYWEGYTRAADGHREYWSHGAGHDANHPVPPKPEMEMPELIAEWTTAKQLFSETWDSINAKRGFSWDSNPWVWVLTFRRIQEAPPMPEGKTVIDPACGTGAFLATAPGMYFTPKHILDRIKPTPERKAVPCVPVKSVAHQESLP